MSEYHQEFESYFLQSFLPNKIQINIESANLQNYFFDLSKSFQLSGYLLNSIDFSEKTMPLKENLIRLNNNYLKKTLIMRYEISKITQLFNQNNIDYVVLKGMAIKIKKIDINRQFRDLDILVMKKDLKRAYELLKESGYIYFNDKLKNEMINLIDMHHLPPMINNSGVTVEIHHRITLPRIFKSCPLTDVAFSEKEICDGINIPSDKFLLAHTFYHGILHHELKSGPVFLLDLKSILNKNPNADNSIIDLLDKVNLTNEYKQAKLLIESCKNKKYVDDLLFKKFQFMFKGNEIFPMKIDPPDIKTSLLRLIKFIELNSYYYKLPYWSPRLIFYIFKNLYKRTKYLRL